MADLIGQMTWWLIAVGLCAAIAGWAFHLLRHGPKLDALIGERDRLRGEFLGFLASDWQPLKRSQADDRELETMRTRLALATAHAAAQERALAELRDRRDELIGRVAELERAAEAKGDEPGEIARLQAALEERPDAEAMNALAWRLRYFEARTRYLESGGGLRAGAPDAALASAIAERDAARKELSDLRQRSAEEARPVSASDDAMNVLHWRVRYLEARVRYLEGQGRPQRAPGGDPEMARRRDWRAHYVERRVRHLQNELRAARADAEALAAARARIGELEAAASEAPGGDVKRLRWKERYLDARVRHLERRLTAPAPLAAPMQAEEAELPIETPQAPAGGGVRPASIPAPRQGAPDDLTLIDGVGPKTEASLHALGIYHFDQIADWRRANVAWLDHYLRLRGRIERERWVEQARELTRGVRARHQLYLEREAV
jgi:predicted flap endonuclease-1-like 5' DNA nuclease